MTAPLAIASRSRTARKPKSTVQFITVAQRHDLAGSPWEFQVVTKSKVKIYLIDQSAGLEERLHSAFTELGK